MPHPSTFPFADLSFTVKSSHGGPEETIALDQKLVSDAFQYDLAGGNAQLIDVHFPPHYFLVLKKYPESTPWLGFTFPADFVMAVVPRAPKTGSRIFRRTQLVLLRRQRKSGPYFQGLSGFYRSRRCRDD